MSCWTRPVFSVVSTERLLVLRPETGIRSPHIRWLASHFCDEKCSLRSSMHLWVTFCMIQITTELQWYFDGNRPFNLPFPLPDHPPAGSPEKSTCKISSVSFNRTTISCSVRSLSTPCWAAVLYEETGEHELATRATANPPRPRSRWQVRSF